MGDEMRRSSTDGGHGGADPRTSAAGEAEVRSHRHTWPRHHRGGRYVPVHPDDPTRPRLFYAVPVPGPAREVIADLAERVQAAVDGDGAHVRWVRMEGLHLTLRFLGPTPEERVADLAARADREAARGTAFRVEIAGAGAFPDDRHPRTLWLGLREGAERLAGLAERIEAGIGERLGTVLETRPFAPHLTIARTDGVRAAPRAAAILEELAADLDLTFVADRLVLYRSHLGVGRATYEPLHEALLPT